MVQALGIDSIMFYGPLILLAAGFASPAAAQAAVVGVGAIKVVALLIATVLVDKVGRRPLMLCSTIGKNRDDVFVEGCAYRGGPS